MSGKVNGLTPAWRAGYYSCPYCATDEAPCDQVAFHLPDGYNCVLLLASSGNPWFNLLWLRKAEDYGQSLVPHGVVLTKLVGMRPCPQGDHLWWQWRWFDESEFGIWKGATNGPDLC